MLVLLGISVAISLIGHSLTGRYLLASFLSGVISISAFLAIVLMRGERDPFIAIAWSSAADLLCADCSGGRSAVPLLACAEGAALRRLHSHEPEPCLPPT